MPASATLVVSLVGVTLGAELVVRYASRLGLRLGLSPLFVGLTIVAAGTSMPELVTSLIAARQGQPDIAIGNVVGSNLFNIAVILGISALVRPLRAQFAQVRADAVLATLIGLVPWLALATGGVLPRWLGAGLVGGFVVYTARTYRNARRETVDDAAIMAVPGAGPEPAARQAGVTVGVLGVAAGFCLLIASAHLFVGAAVDVARAVGLSELVIGLTIVAAGTSMPELATSVVAAVRGQSDVALGNVLGSNVFNMLVVLGGSALVAPPTVAPAVLRLDTPALLVAHLVLIPIVASGGRISRREGLLLLAGYVAYAAYRVGG